MENEKDLEKAEAWDFDKPEIRGPVKTSRVVVSVAFRRDDFATVTRSAERSGKKVSEFIREAALEKASGHPAATLTGGSGSVGTAWWGERSPITRVQVFGLSVQGPVEEAATTYG
jgi:hypothetical protein